MHIPVWERKLGVTSKPCAHAVEAHAVGELEKATHTWQSKPPTHGTHTDVSHPRMPHTCSDPAASDDRAVKSWDLCSLLRWARWKRGLGGDRQLTLGASGRAARHILDAGIEHAKVWSLIPLRGREACTSGQRFAHPAHSELRAPIRTRHVAQSRRGQETDLARRRVAGLCACRRARAQPRSRGGSPRGGGRQQLRGVHGG
jgi:hypothetical protein